MRRKLNGVWLQAGTVALCAAPFIWHHFTVQGPEFVTQERLMAITGLWSLRFLIVALAIRPAAELLRQPWLLRCRRAVGLAAFVYAVVHAATYAVRGEPWQNPAALLQPYLVVGITGLLLLVPLAATSTGGMIRRLGPSAWRRLHQAIYLAAPLAVIHQILVNSWPPDAMVYGGLIAVLLAWRLRPAVAAARQAR